jgi:ABC-type sugar transport system substrate-binding protein
MTSRSTTKSRAALAAVAVSGLVLLAACGGDTKPADGATDTSGSGSENKTIAFSPLGLQIAAMKQLSEGVTAYAKQKGYEVIVQDPAMNPTKQVTDLQSVIESGRVAGAWSLALQPASMKQLVATAQEKGVPLILNGVPADYGLDGLEPGVSFSTIDYQAEGQAIGQELGNCINEKLDGKAQVIWGDAPPGTAGAEELDKAAVDALKATAPDAEIVTHVTISDRTAAQTDIGNALQGNPNAQAVMGLNDEGALGAIGAYKAAGKKLACVTEGGGNDESVAAAKAGEIYAVVALQFAADMAQSFDALVKMIDDPEATGVQLTVPQEVVKAGS